MEASTVIKVYLHISTKTDLGLRCPLFGITLSLIHEGYKNNIEKNEKEKDSVSFLLWHKLTLFFLQEESTPMEQPFPYIYRTLLVSTLSLHSELVMHSKSSLGIFKLLLFRNFITTIYFSLSFSNLFNNLNPLNRLIYAIYMIIFLILCVLIKFLFNTIMQ